jgi:hypothetical protein
MPRFAQFIYFSWFREEFRMNENIFGDFAESGQTFSKRDIAAMRDELRYELRDKKREKKRAKRRGKGGRKLKQLKHEVKFLRKALRKSKKLRKPLKARNVAQQSSLWRDLLKQNTPIALEILYRLVDRNFLSPPQGRITDPTRLLTDGRGNSRARSTK